MKALSHFRTFGVICPLITCTSFYNRKAPSLKYPPSPHRIQGEKVNDPLSLYCATDLTVYPKLNFIKATHLPVSSVHFTSTTYVI